MGEVKTAPVTAQLVDSIVSADAHAGAIDFYKTAATCPARFHLRSPVGAVPWAAWPARLAVGSGTGPERSRPYGRLSP